MSSTSAANTETVMSLRINLEEIKPLVWRRILVPRAYTFQDLSVAINATMGWSGDQSYEFSIKHPLTSRETEIGGACIQVPTKVRKTTGVADIFIDSKVEVIYEYSMCFSWIHVINWEKDVPVLALEGEKYPKCIGGSRIPPPEDEPPEWDTGSNYSYSDVEQNFHHSKVDMRMCLQFIIYKSQLLDFRIASMLSSDSSWPAVKRRLIASQTSAVSTVNSETITSPVATVKGEPKDSSTPAAKTSLIASQISDASTATGDTIYSPVVAVQDLLDDTSSSSIHSHMKKKTDQDVEDMYGKYIAFQMRLLPDLEAREDMRCDIQSIIKKYRFQKK